MTVTVWGVLNIYVFLLTFMLLTFSRKERIRSSSKDAFNRLLVVVMILLVMDFLSRLQASGVPEWQYVLARIGSWGVFAFDPVGYSVALLYIASYVDHPMPGQYRFFMRTMISYAVLNFTAVTLSEILRLGWFYTYTDRVYARGPLFVPRAIVNVLFCVIVEGYVLICRKYIHSNYRRYIEVFPLIVILGGALQVLVSGAAYEYAATTFACIMLYTHVQNRNLNIDYLTGIMNRRGIDKIMENSIGDGTSTKPFAAFMIDLDFFKKINDNCGHESGDQALQTIAVILQDVFHGSGSVGRYGGDEFMVVSTLSDPAAIEEKVEEVYSRVEQANKQGGQPYTLGLSIGWAIYDKDVFSGSRDFLKYIDDEMYEQKQIHHRSN